MQPNLHRWSRDRAEYLYRQGPPQGSPRVIATMSSVLKPFPAWPIRLHVPLNLDQNNATVLCALEIDYAARTDSEEIPELFGDCYLAFARYGGRHKLLPVRRYQD